MSFKRSMLKKLLKTKFHLRPVFLPLIRYRANNLGNFLGINNCKRDVPIIVSLTSYDERFDELSLAIYSLLMQSVKPDRIILWLSDEYNDLMELPYEITRYIKNGLEIRFVKDIKSYTKIIYALKEFSDSIIVTADDDIYYPKNWLANLYYSYISYPNDIQVHRAHRVFLNKNEIMSYEKWEKHVSEECARFDNFLTGVGGVLYPPNCFKKEVLRDDLFLKLAPTADDVWLWAMALLSNRKIRVVKNHIKTLASLNIKRQIFNTSRNLYQKNSKGGNDKQINALLEFYRLNILSKLV